MDSTQSLRRLLQNETPDDELKRQVLEVGDT
jgi:hypothetical protein